MGAIARAVAPRLLAALGDTPAVMLPGPRRAGKSTLVRSIARGGFPDALAREDDRREEWLCSVL